MCLDSKKRLSVGGGQHSKRWSPIPTAPTEEGGESYRLVGSNGVLIRSNGGLLMVSRRGVPWERPTYVEKGPDATRLKGRRKKQNKPPTPSTHAVSSRTADQGRHQKKKSENSRGSR